MAIVKTVRHAGRSLGATLDAEDRKYLGQGLVLAAGSAIIVVGGAGIIGLAIRVFEVAAG